MPKIPKRPSRRGSYELRRYFRKDGTVYYRWVKISGPQEARSKMRATVASQTKRYKRATISMDKQRIKNISDAVYGKNDDSDKKEIVKAKKKSFKFLDFFNDMMDDTVEKGKQVKSSILSKVSSFEKDNVQTKSPINLSKRAKMFSNLDEQSLASKQLGNLHASKIYKISSDKNRADMKSSLLDIGQIALNIDKELLRVKKSLDSKKVLTEEEEKFKQIIDELIQLQEIILNGNVLNRKDAQIYINKLSELQVAQTKAIEKSDKKTKKSSDLLQEAIDKSSENIINVEEVIAKKWNQAFTEKMKSLSEKIQSLPVTDELTSALGMALTGPLWSVLEELTGQRGFGLLKTIAMGIYNLPRNIINSFRKIFNFLTNILQNMGSHLQKFSKIFDPFKNLVKVGKDKTRTNPLFQKKGDTDTSILSSKMLLGLSKGLGVALAVAGTAFAGWNIGTKISDWLTENDINIFKSVEDIYNSIKDFFGRIWDKVKDFFSPSSAEAAPVPKSVQEARKSQEAVSRTNVAQASINEKITKPILDNTKVVSGTVLRESRFPELGYIAAKEESGKAGYAAISSGKGDPGKASYGKYQLASAGGEKSTLSKFLKYTGYEKEFEGLQPGTPEFNKKWQEMALQDKFRSAQDEYIKKTHFDPAAAYASKKGFDMNDPRMQEAIFSASVQHGGVNKIIDRAASTKDWETLSPEEKIKRFYEERKTYAVEAMERKGADKDVIESVKRRYGREESAILAMDVKPTMETMRNQAAGTTAGITDTAIAGTALMASANQGVSNTNVNMSSTPSNTGGSSAAPQQFPVIIDDLGIVLASSGLV